MECTWGGDRGVIGQKICRIMIQINVYHLQKYVHCAVFVDEQYV